MNTNSTIPKRKNRRLFVLFIFCLLSLSLKGQQVNVVNIITPPFGYNLQEYAYQMRVMLTASQTQDYSLRLEIKGNNGITLNTPQNYLPFDIVLQQNIPYTVNGFELESYLDYNNLSITGISQAELARNGLPEGRYQICIAVINSDGEQVSPVNGGCSNFFSVNYIDPPRLITPICGNTIQNTQSQNIVFSWSTPPGANPTTIEYSLRMVEMANHNLPPEQALSSNALPFFETEVFWKTSFFYGPNQPLLEKGKKYAFEVVAKDDELQLKFENQGRSEACWFQFGEAETFLFDPIVADVQPTNDPIIPLNNNGVVGFNPNVEPAPWLLYSMSSLQGQLRYYFNEKLEDITRGNSSLPNTYAFAAAPIKFKVRYYLKSADGRIQFLSKGEFDGLQEKHKKIPHDLILGSSVTDKDGNFKLIFTLTDSLGLLQKNINIGANEFPKRGDLYRAIFVEVQDNHYLHSENPMIINPGDSKDIGDVYTKVRSYTLQVQFDPPMDIELLYNGSQLDGIEVLLLRKTTPKLVPLNEVLPEVATTPAMDYYTVVGTAVTNKNGEAKFERVVFSQDSNDKYYLKAKSKTTEDHSYYYPIKSFIKTEEDVYKSSGEINFYQRALYNSEINPIVVKHKIYIRASDPIVHGQVREITQNKTLANANVSLIKIETKTISTPLGSQSYSYPKTIKQTTSNSNGDYTISFDPYKEKKNGIWTTSPYYVLGSKSGYNNNMTSINGNSLVQYAKKYKRDIVLEPDAILSGKITTESKKATPCKVFVIDANGHQISKSISTSQLFVLFDISNGNLISPEWAFFELKVPSGKHFLVIDPDNNNYFQDTIPINLSKGENNIQHVLKEKAHRINVVVVNQKYYVPTRTPNINISNATLASDFFIKNANVEIVNRGISVKTDDKGKATFKPFQGGSNFTIKVTASPDQDFETAYKDVVNSQISKDYKTIVVYMKRAASVSGRVTLDGVGAKDADVVVLGYESEVKTKTDANGNYKLRNVPIGNAISIAASKSGSNLFGQTKQLDITSSGLTNVDFILTEPQGIDWTTIWGFPVAVDTASIIQASDHWIISGRIDVSGSDNGLKANEGSVPFYALKVKPKSTTDEQAVPVDPFITLDKNSWQLTYNEDFKLIQSNSIGLQIKEFAIDIGGVFGEIKIDADNSFDDVKLDFSKEAMYLTKNAKAENLYSIMASYNQWNPSNYFLQDKNGEGIDFKWQEFDITSDATSGKLRSDQIDFNAIVHTQIPNITPSDLALNVGKMILKKSGVQPMQSSGEVKADLEQWQLKATKWNFTNNGFVLQEGIIKTHAVDVPFTNMAVKPKQLQYGQYQLDQLTLNGVLDFTVKGNADFYYDGQHWKLAIVPKNTGEAAATIKALPAMNTDLSVLDVSLFSNKTGAINVDNKPVLLHNLLSFEPEQIIVDDQQLKIPGLINTGIPEVPKSNGAVLYTKQGNQLQFGLQPFKIKWASQGVILDFDVKSNSLVSDNLNLKGTLSEYGLYSFNVELAHQKNSSLITCLPGNEFKMGHTGTKKLTQITGAMKSSTTSWKPFEFEGDFVGTKGMDGRLKFKVIGDLKANNQEVNIDNIDSPFGNLNVTYEFDKAIMRGHLEFDKELGSSGQAKGAAEFVVGDPGWYFCGGASLTMENNPYIKKANMALLFGDYPVGTEPFIRQTFETYAYEGKFPSAFSNNISGFYIDGSAEFPLPYVPDIDVDLVVVSGELWARAGGSFNMGMNFSDAANYFRTGAEVYITAHIGIGGSVVVACAGASFDAKLTLNALGEYFSDGRWFLNAGSTLKLTGSAYAGGGCCDSDCDWIKFCPAPCFSDSWSGTKSFGIKMHMGSDKDYINVDF